MLAIPLFLLLHLPCFAQDYEAMAASGDTKAMVTLGVRAAHGGVNDEAMRWWKMAAEAGNSWGYLNAGVHYREGIGVQQDLVFACVLLRKAEKLQTPGNRDDVARLSKNSRALLSPSQLKRCDKVKLKKVHADEILSHQPSADGKRKENTKWQASLARLAMKTVSPKRSVRAPIQKVQMLSYLPDGVGLASLPANEERRFGEDWAGVGEWKIPAPPLGAEGVVTLALLEADTGGVVFISDPEMFIHKEGAHGAWEVASVRAVPLQAKGEVERILRSKERVQEVYSDQMDLSMVKTQWGEVLQQVIINPVVEADFPLSKTRVCGERSKIHHVGVIRMVQGEREVQLFSMIVAAKGGNLDEVLEDAVGRMEGWMGLALE